MVRKSESMNKILPTTTPIPHPTTPFYKPRDVDIHVGSSGALNILDFAESHAKRQAKVMRPCMKIAYQAWGPGRTEREEARENLNQGMLVWELLSGTDLDSLNGMRCYCVALCLPGDTALRVQCSLQGFREAGKSGAIYTEKRDFEQSECV